MQDAKEILRLALPHNPGVDPDIFLGNLISTEPFWAALQPFLFSRGYALRPRYRPDWVPSWINHQKPLRDLAAFEDALTIDRANLMDGTRAFDGLKVVFKCVDTATEEIDVVQYLNSPTRLADPRNRTVQILEIIPLPGDAKRALIVMPLLYSFDRLPFRRVGEFAEAVRQLLQGLEFMHEHNVTHRDACYFNIMMDASRVIPRGFHFMNQGTHDGVSPDFKWRERWSVRPLQYYFIDFGLSQRYPPGQKNIRETGIFGQDRSVPEHSLSVPYDPFKSDVYQLGNVILQVIRDYKGLDAFLPVGQAMTKINPDERPSASEALRQLNQLSLGWWTLRCRVVRELASSRQ